MDQVELKTVLTAITEVNASVTKLQTMHEVLNAINREQHIAMDKTLQALAEGIKDQNGRVTENERFREKILTQIKTVPAVISIFVTGVTLIAGWMVKIIR